MILVVVMKITEMSRRKSRIPCLRRFRFPFASRSEKVVSRAIVNYII